MVNPNGEKPSEEVNKLFNTFLTGTFIFFAILAVLIFIFAEPILQFIIHSNNPELVSLSAMHLKIMTPVILIGGIIVAINTILKACGKPIDFFKKRKNKENKEEAQRVLNILKETLPEMFYEHDLETRKKYRGDRENYLNEIKNATL
jgi:Mg2+/Co2+ transporter CorB